MLPSKDFLESSFFSLLQQISESVAFCCFSSYPKLALLLRSVPFEVRVQRPSEPLLTRAKVPVTKFMEGLQLGSTPHTRRLSLVLFQILLQNQEVFHWCLLNRMGTCFQERRVVSLSSSDLQRDQSLCWPSEGPGTVREGACRQLWRQFEQGAREHVAVVPEEEGCAVVTHRQQTHVLRRSRAGPLWQRREEVWSTGSWGRVPLRVLEMRKPRRVCRQGGHSGSSRGAGRLVRSPGKRSSAGLGPRVAGRRQGPRGRTGTVRQHGGCGPSPSPHPPLAVLLRLTLVCWGLCLPLPFLLDPCQGGVCAWGLRHLDASD